MSYVLLTFRNGARNGSINTPFPKWGAHISTVGHGFAIREDVFGMGTSFEQVFPTPEFLILRCLFFSLFQTNQKCTHF